MRHRHFVQHHIVEKYGRPIPGDFFMVYSNKAYEISQSAPGIVWLLSCEGRPRRFSVSWRFETIGFTASDNPDFKFAVMGSKGQHFDPPIPLSEDALKLVSKVTKHFQFGFTELDEDSIKALEATVKPKKKVSFERSAAKSWISGTQSIGGGNK